MNGGSCYRDTNSKFRCKCPERYTGYYCEVDSCSSYCGNNGKCSFESVKGPICECDPNFTGERCETDTRICADCPTILPPCITKCKNAGLCVKDGNGAESCLCVGQWSGLTCELPPKCVNDECGRCNETSSINECL